jgi:hypothetical protein
LLDAGAIGGDDYLTLLNAFAQYPEPEIISALLNNLYKIRYALIPGDLRDQFAGYIRAAFRPSLEKFGLQKKEGETEAISLLRPQLLEWLGREGQDREVRRYCNSLAVSYMSDPASVDASLAEAALKISAVEGDIELFEAYQKHFENARVPAERKYYLAALGHSQIVNCRIKPWDTY